MAQSDPYHELRQNVLAANLAVRDAGLAPLTWGNVSAADHKAGVCAIKPSGVPYDTLTVERIVVIDLSTGEVVAGNDRPSTDTPTHLALYRWNSGIGGVVHTHSPFATSFAQAQTPIPCLGTTHADHFAGEIPVTRHPSPEELETGYESATGEIICEHFRDRGIDPVRLPAVLLPNHGPFVWGKNADNAVSNAIALEAVAMMAATTLGLRPDAPPLPERLAETHFARKHGPNAYYGQKEAK